MSSQGFVRFASPCDKPAIEALLRAGFGDEEEFLRAFFVHLYPHCNTAVSLDGDDIAAMAALIPCQVVLPGEKPQDALYLYSLTTLPAFRGRGHAQKLLDAAQQKCDRVFLHAADDSLFSMYAARGWRSMMHARWVEMDAAAQPLAFQPCTGEAYHALRAQHLANAPHIAWNLNTCRFLHDLLTAYDGGLYSANSAIAAVLDQQEDCLFIAEALGENAAPLAQALAHARACKTVKILTPCTSDAPGAFPYAQGVGTEIPDPIYLSFVYL